MEKILDCPICGSKAFLRIEEPDGFFMGWAIGCPRYRINDGIHIKRMAFHNFNKRDKAIENWNKYVRGIGNVKDRNNGSRTKGRVQSGNTK